MSSQRIVFASGNAGKVKEISAMLGDAVQLVLQAELDIEGAEETGTTFAENALLKARHAAACSGLPALADDSGIEVDALAGEPGVYSARYAGVGASDADNVHKLLRAMHGEENRTARFRCVLAYVRSADDPQPVLAEGSWEGSIANAEQGSGGFGYDPIFVDEASGISAAELSAEQKNARSHRGQALLELRKLLATIL